MENTLCVAPIDSPKYPLVLKNLAGVEVAVGDPNVTRALVAIMDMYSVFGGAASHWGGPAGLADAMSALHALMFKEKNWFDHYNFVNDIGHGENGIYALRANLGYGDLTFDRLKGFRSIESNLTGHGESHLYPEGVLLSNGPLGSSLGQAQGLAMSDRLKNNNRITISVISDGACMEGEAKEALAAIPGLALKNLINPYLLVISDNNTKLSGRIDSDSFSMTPSFNSLESLGWDTVTVEQGNDAQACYLAMEDALGRIGDNKKPIALILKTVKGYGVKATAESASGGHGFPLKAGDGKLQSFIDEIFNNKTPQEFTDLCTEFNALKKEEQEKAPGVSIKIQAGFADALNELKEKDYPIVAISSDLQGSTGIAPFCKKYPESSFDMGIAESNMVSVAAGFAKNGFIPVVDTFAAFGITKGNLPLIMSRLSSCPMIALFTHTGMQDAADGASHQSTTYFSAVASIPGVKILCPSNKKEAYTLLKAAVMDIQNCSKAGKEAPSYVFFAGRENYPEELNTEFDLEKAQVIKEGTDLTIVATGPMVHLALRAATNLAAKGLSAEVINHSQINFPDIKTIGASVEKTKKLLTIEDHQIIGGMGSLLNHELKLANKEYQMDSIGINNHFGRSAYGAEQLYDLFKMGVNDIAERAINLNR